MTRQQRRERDDAAAMTVPLRLVLYSLTVAFGALAVEALLMGFEAVSVGCAVAALLLCVALLARRRAR